MMVFLLVNLSAHESVPKQEQHLMWLFRKIQTSYETGGLVFYGILKLVIYKYYEITQGWYVYQHYLNASTLITS